MYKNELLCYEKPEVELVLLQPEGAILQASRAAASTQSLDEEDYKW